MYTKAEQVDAVYYEAALNNTITEGCYALAVYTAWELGGIEVVSTHSRPKAAGGGTMDKIKLTPFQLTAARRRLVFGV